MTEKRPPFTHKIADGLVIATRYYLQNVTVRGGDNNDMELWEAVAAAAEWVRKFLDWTEKHKGRMPTLAQPKLGPHKRRGRPPKPVKKIAPKMQEAIEERRKSNLVKWPGVEAMLKARREKREREKGEKSQ